MHLIRITCVPQAVTGVHVPTRAFLFRGPLGPNIKLAMKLRRRQPLVLLLHDRPVIPTQNYVRLRALSQRPIIISEVTSSSS